MDTRKQYPNLNNLFISDFVVRSLRTIANHNERILDIGCGHAPYRSAYEGIFAIAVRTDHDKSDESPVHVVADAQSLPFGSETFDAVLCSEVIEHLPDAHLAFSEIARVLRPGGVLLLTWPFAYPLHDIPDDYARYTEFGVQRLLNDSGLCLTRLERRGGMFGVLLTMAVQTLGLVGATLRRTPLVGGALGWTCSVLALGQWLVLLPYFYLARYSFGSRSNKPGDGLSGLRGQFSLWTLGYCALAEKKENKKEGRV